MNNQVSYFIIASDISTDNSEIMMNDNKASFNNNENCVQAEPNDVYEANIEPESITIKMEITPPNPQINELKPNDSTAVILSTEKVIIKEELDIEEMLYDESTPNWDVDPLAPDTETEKLECEICGGNFKQSRQLDNHLFIMHRPLTVAGTGAYCNKCDKWFAELKYPNHNPCFNYMRSIQNGKKMHSCEVCDRDFTAVSLLKAHLVEAHRPRIAHESVDISEVVEEKIICNICEAEFLIKRGLIQHLTLIHRPYTFNTFNLKGAYCTRCQSCFTEDTFIDHGPCISPLQNIPVFRCHICNNEFQLLHLLKTHLYVIHRPLTLQYSSDAFCDKCNRWFKEDNYTMHKCVRRNAMLNLNTDNNNDKYKCAICSKIFETDAELKKHLYDVHRPIVTDDFCNIFCDFCKNTFVEDEFEGHVPCHSVDSKCMFCLISMPSKNHYLLHDLTWKKWRSYQCNMCDLNTQEMRLANLNEHMMTWHGKKSIFRCVKCKFDFISTENAQAHIESIHFGCRCVMNPCACNTYNYDYYYEFVKQRNITDFRDNSKNLLENEITIIREEQYNSIEADIDVCHMKTEINTLENSDLNNLNFQTEYDQPGGLINNFSMPSTSTSTTTIMEDFSSYDSNTWHSSESGTFFIKTEGLLKQENIEDFEENEDLFKGENEDLLKEEEFEIDIVETKIKVENNEDPVEANYEAILKLENEHIADVVIEKKGSLGFGFTLVGERPCKLNYVVPGSSADLAGLQNSDAIIEINGCNVLPLAHDAVVSLIKRCAGNLKMKILFKVPEEYNFCTRKREVFKCHICNRNYKTTRMLDKHLICKHRPTIDDENKIEHFHCNKCRQNFIEYLKFLYHDPCAVNNLDSCTICFLAKPTLAHYELHNLLYRNRQYVCTICPPLNRVTLTLSAMNEHRKTGHSKIGVFECLKCKLDFSSLDEIKVHLMQHLNNNEIMDPEIYKLKEETQLLFKCKVCQKLMCNAQKLEVHEKTHERKHLCSVCGKIFRSKSKLNNHVLVHSNVEQFACHICESKFVLKKNLLQHLKIHEDKKSFTCEECGQGFTQQTSLIYHVASHTNEDLFRCVVCKIKFDKQSKLTAHMEIHNKDDTNTNKCSICDKYFTHKCKLIVHLRLHRANVKGIEEIPNNAMRKSNRRRRKDNHVELMEHQLSGDDSCSSSEDKQIEDVEGINEHKDEEINERKDEEINEHKDEVINEHKDEVINEHKEEVINEHKDEIINEQKDKRRSNRKRTQINTYVNDSDIYFREEEIDKPKNKRGRKRKS